VNEQLKKIIRLTQNLRAAWKRRNFQTCPRATITSRRMMKEGRRASTGGCALAGVGIRRSSFAPGAARVRRKNPQATVFGRSLKLEIPRSEIAKGQAGHLLH